MPSRQMRSRLPDEQSLAKGGRMKRLVRDGRQDLDLGGMDTTAGTKSYTGSPIAGKALDIDALNEKDR